MYSNRLGGWVRFSDYEADLAKLRDRHDEESEKAEAAEAQVESLEARVKELEGERDKATQELAAELAEARTEANRAEALLLQARAEFESRAAAHFGRGKSSLGCCYENAAAFLTAISCEGAEQ
jgi:hypothetical protein